MNDEELVTEVRRRGYRVTKKLGVLHDPGDSLLRIVAARGSRKYPVPGQSLPSSVLHYLGLVIGDKVKYTAGDGVVILSPESP